MISRILCGMVLFLTANLFSAEVIIKFRNYPTGLTKTGRENYLTNFQTSLPTRFLVTSSRYLLPLNRSKTPLDAVAILNLPEETSPEELVDYLRSTPGIDYVQKNRRYLLNFTPSDPRYPEQWYLQKIQAQQA